MNARQVWFWDISGQRESPGLNPALYLLCGKNVGVTSFSRPCISKEEKKDYGYTESPAILEKVKEFWCPPKLYLLFPAAMASDCPHSNERSGCPWGPEHKLQELKEHSTFHIVISIKFCTQSMILQNEAIVSSHKWPLNLLVNYRGICTSSTNRVMIGNICCFSCSLCIKYTIYSCVKFLFSFLDHINI